MRSAFILTVVFAVLKLTGVVTFSWLWVLSPMPILLGIAIALGIVLAVVQKSLEKSFEKQVQQNLQVVR